MDSSQRSIVTSVHGLQHIERLLAAHLTDDDSVGPHTEGIDDEVANADSAMAFDVGWASFHARHVCLAQPQLGGIFDGDNALIFRNVGRQHVKQCRFAGTGSARDDDVQTRLDAALQQLQHAFGHRQFLDQVLALQRVAAETANGEKRAVYRYRRDGGIDARSVRQPGVHKRR